MAANGSKAVTRKGTGKPVKRTMLTMWNSQSSMTFFTLTLNLTSPLPLRLISWCPSKLCHLLDKCLEGISNGVDASPSDNQTVELIIKVTVTAFFFVLILL